MKSTAEIKTKPECCSGYEKSPRTSRALKITTYSSKANPAHHSSLFTLSSEELKAVRAHTLQAEQRRSIAIENARRATYL